MPVEPHPELPGLIDHARVTADDITAAVTAAMAGAEELLAAVVAVPDAERTFDNTIAPLDLVDDLVSHASGNFTFQAHVSADEALRDAALASEAELNTYATGLGFRADVHRAVEAFAASPDAAALDHLEARYLGHVRRDFRRNGMALSAEARGEVQRLEERLVQLGLDFRHNIDQVDDAILLPRDRLAGLPDSYVEGLDTAEVDGETRYRVSLDYPELFPFLENALDGEARRELFLLNHTKAAGVNLPILAEALAVRDRIAGLLGYPSWASYVLEVRMAETPEAAEAFLVDLEAKVRVKADVDFAVLARAKVAHTGSDEPVQQWEWRFYTERVLREHHQVDAFEVAQYFPLDAVLAGLFDHYQRLVGVRFVEADQACGWHPDVRLFSIVDADSDEMLSYFYLDLHPRPGKFGHAAAFTMSSGRCRPDDSYQRPASAIVANFTKPTADTASLLRHNEVVTLFHEFGHILHQTMTRSPYTRFSGTRVERDFVEAPSQMLEHWCWEPRVLGSFARHHRTGEPIPADLVERMVAAKNVSSGIAALRQIYFARLDLAYHGGGPARPGAGSASQPIDTDAIAESLHSITGFRFEPGTHFQAGFGHLFGYDAGYYGYLWAKVYGDDMYTRFSDDAAAATVEGRRYRELVLERGGTVDGSQLVGDFLGREPDSAAFLADLGLS